MKTLLEGRRELCREGGLEATSSVDVGVAAEAFARSSVRLISGPPWSPELSLSPLDLESRRAHFPLYATCRGPSCGTRRSRRGDGCQPDGSGPKPSSAAAPSLAGGIVGTSISP